MRETRLTTLPLYAISDTGELISYRYGKRRVLKLNTHKQGYRYHPLVGLIHRLVAATYLPNPAHLPQVNHLDGDPANNVVSNLEWCTPARNTQHAHGLPPLDEPAICAGWLAGTSALKLAKLHGCSPSGIRSIVHRNGAMRPGAKKWTLRGKRVR